MIAAINYVEHRNGEASPSWLETEGEEITNACHTNTQINVHKWDADKRNMELILRMQSCMCEMQQLFAIQSTHTHSSDGCVLSHSHPNTCFAGEAGLVPLHVYMGQMESRVFYNDDTVPNPAQICNGYAIHLYRVASLEKENDCVVWVL